MLKSYSKAPDSVRAERERRGCNYCADRSLCHSRIDKCRYPELGSFTSYDAFMESGAPDDVNEWIHDLFGVYRDSL